MAKTHPRWLAVSAAMLLFGCSDDQESNIYPKPDSSLGPDAGRTSPDAAPTDAAPADAAPADAAPADAAPADARPPGPGHVRIEKQGDGFVLLR
ncbi:MAG: hypothetical protein HY698_17410, partial [Deltaproteobacteria bacterium]|nr:hypothetical protein [Deltaproteobacteria bacterium]